MARKSHHFKYLKFHPFLQIFARFVPHMSPEIVENSR